MRPGRKPKRPDSQGRYFCPGCETWKDPDQYHKRRQSSNGLNTRCIQCVRDYNRDRRYSGIVREFQIDLYYRYPNVSEQDAHTITEAHLRLLEAQEGFSAHETHKAEARMIHYYRLLDLGQPLDDDYDGHHQVERSGVLEQDTYKVGTYTVERLGPPKGADDPAESWKTKKYADLSDAEFQHWLANEGWKNGNG